MRLSLASQNGNNAFDLTCYPMKRTLLPMSAMGDSRTVVFILLQTLIQHRHEPMTRPTLNGA